MTIQLSELPRYWRTDLAAQVWGIAVPDLEPIAMFTNGHVMIAKLVDADEARVLPAPPERYNANITYVLQLLRRILAGHGRPISRRALRNFVGDADWRPSECNSCDGSGHVAIECGRCGHEHACSCAKCRSGLRYPAQSQGIVGRTSGNGDVYFNRGYVGTLLAVIKADEYTYAVDDFFFALTAPPYFGGLSRGDETPGKRSTEPRLRPPATLAESG